MPDRADQDILYVDFSGAGPARLVCGKLSWEINPAAHTKRIMDKVMDAVSKYETAVRKVLDA